MGVNDKTISLEQFVEQFDDPTKIASFTDYGRGVESVVAYADREIDLWREMCMVERACRKLRSPAFRKTVRTVYRIFRFEPCAEDEQRALILRILGVNEWAYYKRIGTIVKILRRPRRR